MLDSSALYRCLLTWIEALGVVPHRTGRAALAHLLTALLCAQSLQPTRLMRALLSAPGVPAAQRYRRVRRLLDAPWLSPAWLTAALVRGALALFPQPAPVLVLDGVQCGRWECLTLGLAVHGRVQVLALRVMVVPRPKGTLTPTLLALIRQVACAWPRGAPPPHLVADRQFPSTALFRLLDTLGWGYTIRLRARQSVQRAGQVVVVRTLLPTLDDAAWTSWDGSYGQGTRTVAGRVVIGRGLPVLRWQQRDAASARQREWRRRQRAHDAGYQRRDRPSQAALTDPWVVLFTTAPDWRTAVRQYAVRWSIESTFRDLQHGWDGRHGWDLEEQVARQTCAAQVDALVQLCALGQLVQLWLGTNLCHPAADSEAAGWLRAWTVHGRLSVWARGRLALTAHDATVLRWCREGIARGTARLADAPPLRVRAERPPPVRLHAAAHRTLQAA
jgi:hypothetical protein